MEKDLYTVIIPATLTRLLGKQIVREKIELLTKEIFAKWAHPELMDKIQVTKRRGKKTGEPNGE